MTTLKERERQVAPPEPTPAYGIEWLVGGLGALVALFGTWLNYGGEDGTIALFRWDWDVAGLHEAWPFSLLIGGLVMLSIAFGMLTSKLSRSERATTGQVVVSGFLALAALAGAITYLLIWIL